MKTTTQTLKTVKVFAPASISNMGSGFDIIGFPLERVGDTLTLTPDDSGRITIGKMTGYADIPGDPEKNIASYTAGKMLKKLGKTLGLTIDIHKAVKAGSGIGSSASSAAAAVVGVNRLLNAGLSDAMLIEHAMEGEAMVSGGKHADNVAPAILGEIVLIRSYNPLDLVTIPSPEQLWAVLLHPHIEIKTEMSRSLLSERIKLKEAVSQMGNVGGLVAGLYTADYDLIGRSMDDVIAEPMRGDLIPGYREVKKTALKNGARGVSISGSGPSVFAVCKGEADAQRTGSAIKAMYPKYQIPFDIYISKVNKEGTQVIDSY